VCGCGSNGQCKNCNSSQFIGFDDPKDLQLFPINLKSQAPGTNEANCSINTQYTDVRCFNFFLNEQKFNLKILI